MGMSGLRERQKAPSRNLSSSPAVATEPAVAPTPLVLLRRAARWLYRGAPDDPKMLELWHPLVSCILGYTVFFGALNWADRLILQSPFFSPIDVHSCPPEWLDDIEACRNAHYWIYGGAEGPESSMRVRHSLAAFLAVYYFCILGLRTAALGWQNIYEALWGCNIGLIAGAAALYYNRPLWSSGMVFALAIDQMLWYVDVISYLLKGKFVIGVAAYLTWEETHWFKKITCAHHLWFTPVVVGLLKVYSPSTRTCFPLLATVTIGFVIQWLLVIIPRVLLPAYAEWPAETTLAPEDLKKAKRDKYGRPLVLIYLNVNLSHGPWKDVKLLPSIYSPKWAFGSRWYQFLPYMMFPWGITNAILCLPFFMLF